jgi:ABC-2 type transport system ATP-binding protein
VLVLDEPTDGLDPVGRSQVRHILLELRQEGRTVFLNSHLLQEVERICDRVAILSDGQLRFEGTIAELTPPHETEVEFRLQGLPDQVRTALGTCPGGSLQGIADDQYRVTLPLGQQADVDRLVDQLRQHNVSILAISRRRKTLEDAFLELVAYTAEIV